ncbi:uncharacterized protein ISCGN_013451 [Ixodes scapularis]
MSRSLMCLLVVMAVLAATAAQLEDPHHGIGGFVSASGHSPRNFGANVGIRGEYDVHRFRNGGKVTVYGEGSQSFGRANGQSYQGKPQGEVGIRMTIPLGP